MSPFLIFSWIAVGASPSTVQPTELCTPKHTIGPKPVKAHDQHTYFAVPRISLTVPASVRAIDLGRIVRAMLMMSSSVRFPLCLMFFSCSDDAVHGTQ
jgi:hypothetical protein